MNKEIDSEKLKSIQIEVLDFVSQYCKEHNLRYYLTYGTLLGAVRHKGYIPWDDDIDIIMPRPDYEELLKHFEEGQSRYKLKNHITDKNFPHPFTKVFDDTTVLIERSYVPTAVGVNIDIFPLDGMPEDLSSAQSVIKKAMFYYKLEEASKVFSVLHENGILKNLGIVLLRALLHFVSPRFFNRKINQICSQYDYDKATNVAMGVAGYGVNEIMPRDIFDGSTNVEFEGKYYAAPIKYKQYLTHVYGDYMQLPPEEQRIPRHSFKAYQK